MSVRYFFIFSLFLAIIPTTSHPQTHVSGNVSGVWGPEGNPYIADSSIVIASGDTLQMLPGVELNLTRFQDFNVYGRLTAIGTETDSIYFHWTDCDTGSYEAFHLEYADTCELSYCIIDSPRFPLSVFHSMIIIENSIIYGEDTADIFNSFASITDSRLNVHLGITFYSNVDLTGNVFDSTPHIGMDVVYSYFSFGDITENAFVNGIGLGGGNSGNILDNSMKSLTVLNTGSPVLVENNEIFLNEINNSGEVKLQDCDGIILRYNSLYRLEIDSDDVCSYYIENNVISHLFKVDDPGTHIEITDNLIVGGVIVTDSASADIIGNTIVVFQQNVGIDANTIWNEGLLGEVRNNVILGSGFGGYGVDGGGSGVVEYNCIYGFDTPIFNVQSSSNNLLTNPQLGGGNPFDYNLQANSPCIDAGDPSFPLDPDSTRRDIGVYFYDQNLDNPPVISSDTLCYTTNGIQFHYQTTATDDQGPIMLSISELPAWLSEEQIDWVSDTVVVSGLVPEDQEDFSFLITCEDGIGQIDTQRVMVEVTYFHILEGALSGTLPAEDSPYLCIADIEVPEGDTLTIEPGVMIFFKYYENNIFKPDFNIYGYLETQGTETDSIYFVSELEGPEEYDWKGISFFNQEADTIRLSYCVIKNTFWGITADSINWICLDHCRFEFNGTSVQLECSSGEIKNSLFSHTFGIFGHYCGELVVHDNDFLELGENDGLEVLYGNLTAWGNYFEGGGSAIDLNIYSSGYVYNNLILDAKRGISINNYVAANVYNNTIVGYTENAEKGINYWSADPVNIVNNIVTGYDYGISYNYLINPYTGYNNVYNNEIADYENAPENVGLMSTTNTNGDSCDIFFNISADPMFVGGEPFDYNLTELSPCVEAGTDVGLPYFGNCPDIGAFESIYTGISRLSLNLPAEFKLYQNYPNPFNAATTLSFNLPSAGQVSLQVFDITGRSVGAFRESPLQKWYPAGYHQVVWDAEGLASGVYFVRLEIVSTMESRYHTNSQTRKVLLMK